MGVAFHLTPECGESPPHINRLVLSGACARDRKLHTFLADTLGQNLSDSAYMNEDGFTAVRGVAAGAHTAMQEPSFGADDRGRRTFECQCSSGLRPSR